MTEPLFIEFANSALYDGHGNLEDLLLDDSWCSSFLKKWGMAKLGPLDKATRAELTELRSTIRSIAERLRVGRTPARKDLANLNAALAASPVQFQLSELDERFELGTVPLAATRAAALIGEIALSMARFLAGPDIDRLKMCDNAGCRWVFHDDTKNLSRKWCRSCGNLDKVRRFRERQALANRE